MNINNINKLISGASPNPNDRNKAANLRKDGPSASLQPHVTNKSEIAETHTISLPETRARYLKLSLDKGGSKSPITVGEIEISDAIVILDKGTTGTCFCK